MAYILIVDDDDLIAQLATETLIDAGHACGWISSGEDAWEVLNSGKRPNLLLMDHAMPGISGTTLLRRLRGSPHLYDLPVIMFTAMSGVDDESQAIFAGAQDFIRKPFDPKVLISRVERLLAKRQTATEHKPLEMWLAEGNGHYERRTPVQRRRMV